MSAFASAWDAISSWIGFGFGLVLIGIGLDGIQRIRRRYSAYRATPGKVLEVRADSIASAKGKRIEYVVLFEFRTERGIVRRFSTTGWANLDVGFEEGQAVTVLYDPELPENAMVKSPGHFVRPTMVLLLGAIIAAVWLVPVL